MPVDFVHATLGGLMIGAAATLMLWLLGRITGISGIFWGALSDHPLFRKPLFNNPLLKEPLFEKPLFKRQGYQFPESSWRWFFIAGPASFPCRPVLPRHGFYREFPG